MALCLLVGSLLKAQEGTRPMSSNINYAYPDLSHFTSQNPSRLTARPTSTGNITLPFFDDFYYASYSQYPDQRFWSDSLLYVNTGMARAPLSIGVATFDGLDKRGYPYAPNYSFTATQAYPADTLTSRPINLLTFNTTTLQPSDSVALIFYYQLTGNGDTPEIQDSLMVDFYKAGQGVWSNRTWALRGNNVPNANDTVFKRAFIWITDTAFFHDGFKFRFRNKAATNGNFDNWHVDYVYLDKNRSIINDTAWNDLTIGYVPSSFLKNFSAMPWHQFNEYEMATKYSNYIRYNGTATVNTTYQYTILDQNNVQVNNASYGASNLPPFKTGGWQHNPVHSNPSLSYTFAPMTDSADFTIKHYMLNLGGDINIGNDTVFQKQRFRNYYAYDDGSCETGYYILGAGGKMANRYFLNVPDTLRALRIYFDPAGAISVTQGFSFRINVFQDGGFGPGLKIYTDSLMHPKYSTSGHNVFATYTLTSPLPLGAGAHYIGFQQSAGNSGNITVGFDRNTDFSTNLYYDSGSGWTQSTTKGSLMMRPVFGKKVEPPVGIKEETKADQWCHIYPNPSSGYVNIAGINGSQISAYAIYALDGTLVAKGLISGSVSTVSTGHMANGIYMMVIDSPTHASYRQKLIIQH